MIPAGAFRTSDPSLSEVQIRIEPVAESRIRDAVSTVTYSRRSAEDPNEEVFGPQMFFQEVLLSPSFECFLPASVSTLPFAANLTYIANIDTTRKLIMEPVVDPTDDEAESTQDICLSTVQIDVANDGYATWRCKNRALLAPGSTDTVSGVLPECGSEGVIYGFTHTPERRASLPDQRKKGPRYVVIVLIILAVAATVALVAYVCKRLHRYRKKYHDERVAVDNMQREVDEMNMFGGQAGTKDDQVAMTSNPLVMQVADVERRLKEKDQDLEAARIEQNEAESNARQDHIGNLKEDKNELQAELERLKAQLAAQQSTRPVNVAQPVPITSASPTAARADLNSGPPARARKKKRDL